MQEYRCQNHIQKSDPIDRQAAIDLVTDMEFMNNTAKGILRERLRKLVFEQPEIIYCRECKHHHYDNQDIPYCDRIDYGYGWKDNDFCSRAERRAE